MATISVLNFNKKSKISDEQRAKNKTLILAQMKDGMKLVKARFINHECPDAIIELPIKLYPGEPMVKYKFKHNQIETYPKGVVDYINETAKQKRKKTIYVDGLPVIVLGTPKVRFELVPVEF